MNLADLVHFNRLINNVSDAHLREYIFNSVANALTEPYFYCFFINLEIDLATNSLDELKVLRSIELFQVGDYGDKDWLKANMLEHFNSLLLSSTYTCDLSTEHQTYVTADEFVEEYYPYHISLEDFIDNCSTYINALSGKYEEIKLPFRHKSKAGRMDSRNVWITPTDRCNSVVGSISGLSEATIVNDYLGLGLRKLSTDGNYYTYYFVCFTYPEACGVMCYKPTAMDGCLYSSPFWYFANTKPMEMHYGCAIKTSDLSDGLLELVHAPLDRITNDFRIKCVGEAECYSIIDADRMRAKLISRLNSVITI